MLKNNLHFLGCNDQIAEANLKTNMQCLDDIQEQPAFHLGGKAQKIGALERAWFVPTTTSSYLIPILLYRVQCLS